jgi:molybdate transport system substrate-binding protein
MQLKQWLVVLCGILSLSAQAGEINAAVAANFAAPMTQIVTAFQQATGHTVKVSLGATGKFYAQIQQGAPFDVLLAADDETPAKLVKAGFGSAPFVYAQGKLVLWQASAGAIDDKVLRAGAFKKLAIADPKLAPYGLAAQQALEKWGLWASVQDKLVRGENISQTYQFVATGNAELGFVALSQVMRDGKISTGAGWIVPANLHDPLKQSALLLSSAKDKVAAQAFLDFLRSKTAAGVMRGFGYEVP